MLLRGRVERPGPRCDATALAAQTAAARPARHIKPDGSRHRKRWRSELATPAATRAQVCRPQAEEKGREGISIDILYFVAPSRLREESLENIHLAAVEVRQITPEFQTRRTYNAIAMTQKLWKIAYQSIRLQSNVRPAQSRQSRSAYL